jgi:uncharacterized glyoxalase superfamily protein PhnB
MLLRGFFDVVTFRKGCDAVAHLPGVGRRNRRPDLTSLRPNVVKKLRYKLVSATKRLASRRFRGVNSHSHTYTVMMAALVSVSTFLDEQRLEVRFHHLHLTGGLAFYARLFEPATTRRTIVAGFDALESGSTFIVFGRPLTSEAAPERPSAIWHFGWGDVSVGDTYLRHAAREVKWEPPLPAEKLHLHLQSPSPATAAGWYRDVLGASIDVLPGSTADRPAAVRPELRLAEAAVRFDRFAMVIHRTNERLSSTRGQRADHVAFQCEDLNTLIRRLNDKGVHLVEAVTAFGDGRHAMIEGPDKIAIELIEFGRR